MCSEGEESESSPQRECNPLHQRTDWGQYDLPELSLTRCKNNSEFTHQRLEITWHDYSDLSWKHPELDRDSDITNPHHRKHDVRLNPVLCASEWPPLLPEYGPACEPGSDDDELPELEDGTKYEYCDHDGGWQDASHLLNNSMIGPSGTLQGCGARCSDNYSEGEDEWEDASHLLHDTEGGPSGHLHGCGAGCAHASDDWSDAESVDYGDSEDECDQWSDQEEWQDATHLLKSSR